MKKTLFCFTLVLLLVGHCFGQNNIDTNTKVASLPATEVIRVEAEPQKGFSYPYYLYVPPELQTQERRKATHTLLVLPNNTGKPADDFTVHDNSVRKRMEQNRSAASALGVAVLMPVFPRPGSDWRIYTHALDRDTMLTEKKEYKRLDLQLVAMIDHARAKMSKEGLRLDQRVLMHGFSASGMFVNRFVLLHPQKIKAAAIGSPGGWAIAPIEKWKGKALRYPIGTADFKDVTGKSLDRKNLKKVPLFLYLGAEDTNDSVVFGDSYDAEDKELIFELFGKTLVERWSITKSIYEENMPQATLKLYPRVGHTVTKEIIDDITTFFTKHLK